MSTQTIVTRQFALEEKVYFKILIRTRFIELWWFYVLVFILVTWNLDDFGHNALSTYMVLLGFIYPIIYFFYLYYLATSRKNRGLYSSRILQFGDSKLVILTEDGRESKLTFSNIVRIVETRTFFLLYITRTQFLYIPRNSFMSEEDLILFEQRLKKSLHGSGY